MKAINAIQTEEIVSNVLFIKKEEETARKAPCSINYC